MGKEDKECKDLAPDDPNIVEMIWAAQTKTDALRCAKKFSMAMEKQQLTLMIISNTNTIIYG